MSGSQAVSPVTTSDVGCATFQLQDDNPGKYILLFTLCALFTIRLDDKGNVCRDLWGNVNNWAEYDSVFTRDT